MRPWIWLLIGIVAGAPLWLLLARLTSQRLWKSARRLSRRAAKNEHLVELGQLVGGLAHEIKNPLSTVNINLKLLSEDIQRYDDEEHRRLQRRIRSVQNEADRLKDILDDVLRFAGKYELALSLTDIRRVVSELADFFSPQAEAARVVMRMSLPDQPVRCNIDVSLIKQALLNLIINAVQAMPGGGELLIRVATTRNSAILEVIDTGSGIPPETLGKIFQVYFSTKKHGSGLGLPTTRRIVLEHHGSIRVDSEVGKGTRFVIELPLAKEDNTREDKPAGA